MLFYWFSIQLYLEAKPFDQKAHYGKRWKDWEALLLKEKTKKNQPKRTLVLVSRGKKNYYYVWICLNKGRDGFVTLTKACY